MISQEKITNPSMITVIVPMYNEADHITHCLQSLTEQTSQNFQAIFIDDGSTDNTLDVLREAVREMSPQFSIKILKQHNTGAAQARALGIKNAITEYIISLDADDRYSNDMISELEKVIVCSQPDIILPNMIYQDADGTFHCFEFFDQRTQLEGMECLANTLGDWRVHGCICVKKEIFTKSYAIYAQYNPSHKNYLNNDEVLTRLNYYQANTVVRIPSTYYYLYNATSTTKSINLRRYGRCENAVIMHKILGQLPNPIAHNVQIELFNTIRHTRRYYKNHKSAISNARVWKKQIRKSILYALTVKDQQLSFKQILNLIKYYITI